MLRTFQVHRSFGRECFPSPPPPLANLYRWWPRAPYDHATIDVTTVVTITVAIACLGEGFAACPIGRESRNSQRVLTTSLGAHRYKA
jgi:hypothetical protein